MNAPRTRSPLELAAAEYGRACGRAAAAYRKMLAGSTPARIEAYAVASRERDAAKVAYDALTAAVAQEASGA